MTATTWAFWNQARHKIANNEINLSAGPFRLALYSTAASGTINTATITVQSEIGTEVSGGAYNAGGLTMAAVTWGTGTSAGQQKFDTSNPVFTATGTDMSNVRFGVIVKSVTATTSGLLLVWSALSTVEFDLTTGNTLTVQMAATGIFTLA